jgi:7,8-dihydropterin-6-yl-methyl-4-(beta-D-ribofuranosyl)aminobenzene 5'-phosphate synthase
LLRVTVLVENRAGPRGTIAEHGLSFWIEAGDRRVLFDTGQGLALAHNAQQLGVDLASADAVVLSHGHYDHTGGLAANLAAFRNTTVYAHPDAFRRRYTPRNENGIQTTSPPVRDADHLRAQVGDLVLTRDPTEVTNGVWVTGAIPRQHAFEDTGGPFYLDPAQKQPDPLSDDQALVLEAAPGAVVLLGCAHAGTVNTLDYVVGPMGCQQIHAVIGGMHLLRASEERLSNTIGAFKRLNVRLLAPGHCTGWQASMRLWSALPEASSELHVGSRFEFA